MKNDMINACLVVPTVHRMRETTFDKDEREYTSLGALKNDENSMVH
jgi:hypothetical protein